jgi:hypothetical protein
MDEDDPEKRIAELERQIQQSRRGEMPGPAPQPAVPTQPLPYSSGYSAPSNAQYGLGPAAAGFRRWQRNRIWRVTRPLWILVGFWAIMIPLGNLGGHFMMHASHYSSPTTIPIPAPVPGGPTAVPHGGTLTVSGTAQVQTIACNDGTLTLSGHSSSYTVTGHCVRLIVSGSANFISVDSADSIDAGGNGTVTYYHSGNPVITKSGTNVVIEKG